MNNLLSLLTLFILSIGITTAQTANSSLLRKKHYNTDKAAIAIKGYDPVSYFNAKKAVEGNKDFAATYEGVTYHFSSAKNRDLFKATPSKFEPQYGGWCAYAMGENGEKVEIDPDTFKIVNGKLYLFYNRFFNNTKKSWDTNESSLKAKADLNWNKTIQ